MGVSVIASYLHGADLDLPKSSCLTVLLGRYR